MCEYLYFIINNSLMFLIITLQLIIYFIERLPRFMICLPWLNRLFEKKQLILIPIQRKHKDICMEYLWQKHSSVKTGKERFHSDTSISRNSLETYLIFQVHWLQFSASHVINFNTVSASLVLSMSGRQFWPADKCI